MNHDKELDQAAEEYVRKMERAHPFPEGCKQDFKAGAHWQRAQAPKAPEEWEKIRASALQDRPARVFVEDCFRDGFDAACDLIARPLLALNDRIENEVYEYVDKWKEAQAKIEALEKRAKELEAEVKLYSEGALSELKINDDLRSALEKLITFMGWVQMNVLDKSRDNVKRVISSRCKEELDKARNVLLAIRRG